MTRLLRPLVPLALIAAALAFVATQKQPCRWVAASPSDPPSFVPGYERIKLWSQSRSCAACHERPPAIR